MTQKLTSMQKTKDKIVIRLRDILEISKNIQSEKKHKGKKP